MRTKDLKNGVPYVYDTGRRYGSFASRGVMFVLTTEIYKSVHRPLTGEAPYVPLMGRKPYYRESSGILAIHVSDYRWEEFASEIRAILSKVTLEDVQASGMRLPENLWDQLEAIDNQIVAEVTVVQPRYLKGDWDTLFAQHKESVTYAKIAAKAAEEEATARIVRWQELDRTVEQMTGHKLSPYGVPSGNRTTVSLEYLEALLRAVQAASGSSEA